MNPHLVYILGLFNFWEEKEYFQESDTKRAMFMHSMARAHVEVTAKGKFSCGYRGKTTLISTKKELVKWLAKRF